MRFDSLHFGLFFPLALLVVWLLRRRVGARNAFLLIASYYFYGCWDWRFLGLILFTTALDWGVGLLLDPGPRAPAWVARLGARRRLVLTASLAANLGVLGFFKYFDFFAAGAAALLSSLGLQASAPELGIVLPVGISFYTFQSMAYTLDVYRRRLPAERDPLRFALYVAFFPQLVAGPIERATNLLPQIASPRPMDLERLQGGLGLIGLGLLKKVVLADNLARPVEAVFSAAEPSGLAVLLGAYAFALQIYLDFSAYSDIARGAARAMGFELMQNFDRPYLATSPREFWRRWHISLSSWLRDYLYIPLGGSRRGELRTRVNLMLTMLLGGLWHGAGLMFLVWGAWHGLLLWFERAAAPALAPLRELRAAWARGLWRGVRVLTTFHLICLGWLMFRAQSPGAFGGLLLGLLDGPPMRTEELGAHGLSIFIACSLAALGLEALASAARAPGWFWRWPGWARAAAYTGGTLVFALFGEFAGAPFIYFQF
ncbi:MAG TPA: MBOAT family O-acyltransferase [Myxococcota bacterium]|nr:MBOAT family O-acyltransferase [Myxococcota bacterium]HRY93514.1 MBOAT family O-acyltransferase [Myxococcota bacterium]HSA21293.1 MBOAT family O-acyltransferase [Myxococcota bacterium]